MKEAIMQYIQSLDDNEEHIRILYFFILGFEAVKTQK